MSDAGDPTLTDEELAALLVQLETRHGQPFQCYYGPEVVHRLIHALQAARKERDALKRLERTRWEQLEAAESRLRAVEAKLANARAIIHERICTDRRRHAPACEALTNTAATARAFEERITAPLNAEIARLRGQLIQNAYDLADAIGVGQEEETGSYKEVVERIRQEERARCAERLRQMSGDCDRERMAWSLQRSQILQSAADAIESNGQAKACRSAGENVD